MTFALCFHSSWPRVILSDLEYSFEPWTDLILRNSNDFPRYRLYHTVPGSRDKVQFPQPQAPINIPDDILCFLSHLMIPLRLPEAL